jgi:hypothetical protein
MPRRFPLLGSRAWMLVTGSLLPLAVTSGFAAPRDKQLSSSPAHTVVIVHKAKPRNRLAVGDQWRVRCSQLPLQQQDPSWSSPETWVFAVTGIERTAEGQRIIVTVTREGAATPTVKLQLDPTTLAVLRADTQVPTAGGFRDFV